MEARPPIGCQGQALPAGSGEPCAPEPEGKGRRCHQAVLRAVHLYLHGFAPEIVAAQIVDVLPQLEELARVIRLRFDDARLPILKFL